MSERDFSRQRELMPDIGQVAASVIGCGAVGRNVGLLLAAAGCRNIQLIDFDIVEETNITTQGWSRKDLGQYKVDALTASIHRDVDADIRIEAIPFRWAPRFRQQPIVFCCVDDMDARAIIFKRLQERCSLFLDSRVLGEAIRILTARPGDTAYAGTLFPQAEAHQGGCTSAMTLGSASIAAGMLVHQFARFLRSQDTDRDIMLTLADSMLVEMAAE